MIEFFKKLFSTSEKKTIPEKEIDIVQWRLKTMANILNISDDELEKIKQSMGTDMMKFNKLWGKATNEQRTEFIKKTKLYASVENDPEKKDELLKNIEYYGADWTQIIPARSDSRGDDIDYFIAPI